MSGKIIGNSLTLAITQLRRGARSRARSECSARSHLQSPALRQSPEPPQRPTRPSALGTAQSTDRRAIGAAYGCDLGNRDERPNTVQKLTGITESHKYVDYPDILTVRVMGELSSQADFWIASFVRTSQLNTTSSLQLLRCGVEESFYCSFALFEYITSYVICYTMNV